MPKVPATISVEGEKRLLHAVVVPQAVNFYPLLFLGGGICIAQFSKKKVGPSWWTSRASGVTSHRKKKRETYLLACNSVLPGVKQAAVRNHEHQV